MSAIFFEQILAKIGGKNEEIHVLYHIYGREYNFFNFRHYN